MINFFHKFLNPHCEHCREEEQAKRICDSCENMRGEKSELRMERDRLLNYILNLNIPNQAIPGIPEPAGSLKPIMPANMPWHVRRRLLEEEDRAKAAAMKNAAKPDTASKIANQEIAKLEEELLAEGSD